MARHRLPASIRKFLRREKTRLRREISDRAGAEEEIQKLVAKVFAGYNKAKVMPANRDSTK
jgi:hypothetical protein